MDSDAVALVVKSGYFKSVHRCVVSGIVTSSSSASSNYMPEFLTL